MSNFFTVYSDVELLYSILFTGHAYRGLAFHQHREEFFALTIVRVNCYHPFDSLRQTRERNYHHELRALSIVMSTIPGYKDELSRVRSANLWRITRSER